MGEQLLFGIKKLNICSDKEFLIHRINQNEEHSYSYANVITSSQELVNCLMQNDVKNARVSVQCPPCPELCVILLSILNCSGSFCPIAHDASEDETIDAVRIYGSRFLITHVCLSESIGSLKLMERKTIYNTPFYIYQICEKNEFVEGKLPNECYCIRTSGSTGSPKVVRVPYQCIEPNIKGLRDLLEITYDDVIFMSSPITFDPFVVEFFLALDNGAALLITSPSIRVTPNRLAEVLHPKRLRGASVVQMTPSLFRLFGLKAIQQIILSKNTSLRILLLGGERFPSIEEISHWTAENHFNTRIFNIYGITEVSCWSTIYELRRPRTEKRIPIGLPIDSETQIRLVNDMNEPILEGFGDIEIGSASRKCVIDNEVQTEIFATDMLFRSTGDIGYISEGSIFYEGRKNEIIKRYGHRVHMGHIVKTILGIEGVLNSSCIFIDETMRLICFILKHVNKSRREIQREIMSKLRKFEKPDDIEFVEYFPVTSHGKISRKELMRIFERSSKNTPIKVFQKFINNILCLDIDFYSSAGSDTSKRCKMSTDSSFLDAGGTSFQALTLSAEIEHISTRPEPKLLEMMLNGTTPISSIFEYISKIKPSFASPNDPSECLNTRFKEMLKVKWQYDTGKCVDATPRCYGSVVCVGSHSHLLITLDSWSGREVSTCVLPDRIECQVTFVDHRLVLVGCYDGNLYAVDYSCGKIEWKFNCGGMIKARPLLYDNLVVIGNYSEHWNLICFKFKEKCVLWKVQIGAKGIFASPLQINKESFLACTLAGETVCVMFNTGNIVWKTKFQSPIFSTPATLTDHAVLVAEVSGLVHCLNKNSGAELWNLQTDGNIFSSLTTRNITDEIFIIFGNHDHNVYCLKTTLTAERPTIGWKSALNSAVYSTPVIMQMSADNLGVVSCSTKGCIYILDFLTGSMLFNLILDNEIFSSPCIVENRIYVGCRNNNIVCLEVEYKITNK